jgi:hypothetical protein
VVGARDGDFAGLDRLAEAVENLGLALHLRPWRCAVVSERFVFSTETSARCPYTFTVVCYNPRRSVGSNVG